MYVRPVIGDVRSREGCAADTDATVSRACVGRRLSLQLHLAFRWWPASPAGNQITGRFSHREIRLQVTADVWINL